MTISSICEKSDKSNLRIISKYYAHLQTSYHNWIFDYGAGAGASSTSVCPLTHNWLVARIADLTPDLQVLLSWRPTVMSFYSEQSFSISFYHVSLDLLAPTCHQFVYHMLFWLHWPMPERNWRKIVGGVAYTRYIVSIYLGRKNGLVHFTFWLFPEIKGVSVGKIFATMSLYASLALIRYATRPIPQKFNFGLGPTPYVHLQTNILVNMFYFYCSSACMQNFSKKY